MDQESLSQIKQIITHATEAAEARLRKEIQDVKRHACILAEHLEHTIDLLSEGHASLHRHIEAVRSESHHDSHETRVLLRASYQELRQRVEP